MLAAEPERQCAGHDGSARSVVSLRAASERPDSRGCAALLSSGAGSPPQRNCRISLLYRAFDMSTRFTWAGRPEDRSVTCIRGSPRSLHCASPSRMLSVTATRPAGPVHIHTWAPPNPSACSASGRHHLRTRLPQRPATARPSSTAWLLLVSGQEAVQTHSVELLHCLSIRGPTFALAADEARSSWRDKLYAGAGAGFYSWRARRRLEARAARARCSTRVPLATARWRWALCSVVPRGASVRHGAATCS